MKAAILHGREHVQVEEVSPVPLRAGEVRMRIEAALTCGTDLKVFKRGYHAKMIVPPAVFGHEMAGVISEVHPTVRGYHVSDRVVVANSAPCGQCYYCRHGQENLCDDLLFLNGAYAESVVVPARIVEKNLWHLKPSTSFRDAALTEPLGCVVQGIEDVHIHGGLSVLILGAGPIGLMFLALAKHLACEVTVAGRGEKRLNTAHRLKANRIVDLTHSADVLEAVRHEANGVFDVVIEAVGKPEAWEAAVKLVRKGGRVNLFGGCPAGTTVGLDTDKIHYASVRIVSSFHHTPKSIRRALDYIESGVIRADDLVDGECPLTRLPELFQSMAAGNRAVKTFIRVHE